MRRRSCRVVTRGCAHGLPGQALRAAAGAPAAAGGAAPGRDRLPAGCLQEQRVAVGPRRAVRPAPRPPRGRRRAPNALQRRRQAEIDRLVAEGRERIGRLSEREFLVAGVALYAGEGTKRDGAVRFANSDPRMIFLFCCWLRRFFEIDESRLRVRLYLHEGLDLAASIASWSSVTAIPPSQLSKPYRAVPDCSIRH